MNRDGSNGIRANACYLRRLKSVLHQHRLFMLASWRKLDQVESFVFVLLSSRHATTPLLPRHSCTSCNEFWPCRNTGGIVLHLCNAIHAMYDHAKTHTLSAVFRLPMIERYVNPAIVQ
jgi:hypothetical protein